MPIGGPMMNAISRLGSLSPKQSVCAEGLLLFVLVVILPMWLKLCRFSFINIFPTSNNHSKKYVYNKMCNLEIKPFYKSFKNVNIFLVNNDMPFKHLNAICPFCSQLDYRLISARTNLISFPTYLHRQETMRVHYRL